MRVLKQGNKHLGVPKKITCRNCESILEYLNTDIIDTKESMYSRAAATHFKIFKIVCPICNKDIQI